MATTNISACCRPEEDPFLLLESTHRAVGEILRRRRGLPLRRSWIAQPYSEGVITLLAEQALLQRCQLEADRRVRGALRLAMV